MLAISPQFAYGQLPVLVVRPSPGLLVLTATLPLYYLRTPLRELGDTGIFEHGVVWLQFGPTLALLAWEAANHAKQQPHSAVMNRDPNAE